MPRGIPSVPLARGEVHGAHVVVRQAARAEGAKELERYVVRESCCGREAILRRANVLHAPAKCTKCSNLKGTPCAR